ncbi:hypothetical protein SGO_2035 [Streptococcus gordonii str. Challis substr. CH1]|uniref:Uncharacterized protein n=1 Tax=Streptococcus gordonii (strain Challis / ATCC 35105 / BCRC 15272 / CH1 / DL1 / V288) TaxID=467705 RepID=A8AZS3_STRGC|nr:hypothetical protein SGO_2035 [Streptococcus gordonii str. Challis substr. CH1]
MAYLAESTSSFKTCLSLVALDFAKVSNSRNLR